MIGVCYNDAQSCYDRIVHVTAYFVLRRLRIPKPMIISMFHTIQMMEHSILILFGHATVTYGSKEWRLKPHGSLKVNGALPMI